MTREEYDKYYNKKFIGLSKDEEEELNKIFKKIEFSNEDKRILDAFYIPNGKEAFTSPEKISPIKMKAELRNIFVLLKYNYCGYDYFNKDRELDKIYEKLKNRIDSYTEEMKTTDYFEIITKELHNVIKDNHFSLKCNDKRFHLSINKVPYFSDLLVEKREDKYVIIKENKYFEKEYIIKENIENYLFKTLSYNDNEAYLIGSLQSTVDPIMNITIDSVNLPLHISKSVNIDLKQKNELRKYDDYNMVILTMCHTNDEFSFKKYHEWGEDLRDGKCAVISVVQNPGGSSLVGSEIISGLNGNGTWNVSCSTLNLFQKTGLPFKYYSYSSTTNNSGKNTYSKPLYVLMNKYTASAGESLVSISNNVKDVIKIGTNTTGCGVFGEVMHYVLPQTHATISISFKTFFMNEFIEGTGFMPDYWMDDENMVDSFIKWLDRKVMV